MSGISKFFIARKAARLSQEETAERAYISLSTYKRIERGTQKPSQDQADALAEVLNASYLADPNTPLDYCPPSLPVAMLKYLKEHRDVDVIIPDLTAILSDGKVSEDEAERYSRYMQEISEACNAARDLRYAVG